MRTTPWRILAVAAVALFGTSCASDERTYEENESLSHSCLSPSLTLTGEVLEVEFREKFRGEGIRYAQSCREHHSTTTYAIDALSEMGLVEAVLVGPILLTGAIASEPVSALLGKKGCTPAGVGWFDQSLQHVHGRALHPVAEEEFLALGKPLEDRYRPQDEAVMELEDRASFAGAVDPREVGDIDRFRIRSCCHRQFSHLRIALMVATLSWHPGHIRKKLPGAAPRTPKERR